jgi:2-isopropylmalate synthase
MDTDRVLIFDTTLRDGEQCPGASMNLKEKLEIARQLARLQVDIIEAGFPVISDGDFESVQTIAREITGPVIAGLARCVPKDIEAAGLALLPAGARARIHVFLATSKIHREHKLRKANEEILRLAAEGVRQAKSMVADVEFSPEDASRTEPEFLAEVVQAAIEAGATTVNIPDTVGYAMPGQYADLISYLRSHVRDIRKAVISVHCHDDLGMAVANSLAAVQAGARQVEGTFNGIGERAGNAALEEVVMAIRTRPDIFPGLSTGIATREILKTSRMISRLSGLQVARSKAIIGENAFAHGSGIHQDGILKKRETYEIMDPRDVGWGGTDLPLTKHSGRHAMVVRLQQLGFDLSEAATDPIFVRFKELGDKKKFVYDDDLIALAGDALAGDTGAYALESLHVVCGGRDVPTASVKLSHHGEILEASSSGNGAVDAAMKAVDLIVKRTGHLAVYLVEAVTEGQDALGEVTLKVDFGDGRLITGKGASTDVIEASARAYVNAINRVLILPTTTSGVEMPLV